MSIEEGKPIEWQHGYRVGLAHRTCPMCRRALEFCDCPQPAHHAFPEGVTGLIITPQALAAIKAMEYQHGFSAGARKGDSILDDLRERLAAAAKKLRGVHMSQGVVHGLETGSSYAPNGMGRDEDEPGEDARRHLRHLDRNREGVEL